MFRRGSMKESDKLGKVFAAYYFTNIDAVLMTC